MDEHRRMSWTHLPQLRQGRKPGVVRCADGSLRYRTECLAPVQGIEAIWNSCPDKASDLAQAGIEEEERVLGSIPKCALFSFRRPGRCTSLAPLLRVLQALDIEPV